MRNVLLMVIMVGAETGIVLPNTGTRIHVWERIHRCGSQSHMRNIKCTAPVCDDRTLQQR